MKRLLLLVFFALGLSSQAHAVVPSQYMAKQYTELLGRAPDASGWQAYTNFFLTNNCSSSLATMAQQLVQSGEYVNKGYSPEETVLTLYRAVLSREPDPSGFQAFVSSIRSGTTPSQVVAQLTASAEFAGLVGDICRDVSSLTKVDPAYRQNWAGTDAIDITGTGTKTDVDVRTCINQNQM